jgi:hypothetical protein
MNNKEGIEMNRLTMGIIAMLAALSVAAMPGAEAASSNYYAQTLVLFNVPTDATFSIAMPANYATWTSITSTSDYPSATATDWISFNYTSAPSATLTEPYQLGAAANNQAGAAKPIYYIDNTGNTNEQFDIKLNQTAPTNVNVYFNGSCVGSCGTTTTTLTAMTASYLPVATTVTTASYLNITLYSNTSAGITGGISTRYIAIRSTAV